jgi:hypothetical protein
MGTFVFSIQDDNGKWHIIELPGSLYIPTAKGVLLSPQHWAQVARDYYPIKNGTGYMGGNSDVTLWWDQSQFKKTVPLNPRTNTPSFRTAPGISKYKAFVADFIACDATRQPVEHVLKLIPTLQRQKESEEEQLVNELILDADQHQPTKSVGSTDHVEKGGQPSEYEPISFDPSPQTTEDETQPEPEAIDGQAELLRWHYCLGHLLFCYVLLLVRLGEIPRHLAKVKPPRCDGCLFGAMTKVPTEAAKPILEATKPGQCVSVDQMISTQVRFIAQLKGMLTRKRYCAATVFVDNFSRV